MSRIRVCLVGSHGKMGQALLAEIAKDKSFILAATVPHQGKATSADINAIRSEKINVVINFTTPRATLASAKYCAKYGLPLVTGTTGLTEKQMASLKQYAKKAPILWSPNMCLVVNLLESMLGMLAQALNNADIEIVEQHHRDKEDSPSGTAKMFARSMAKSTGKKIICSRPEGISKGRKTDEIYIHSLRGGEVPGGKNEVHFLAGQEEILISHRALSNNVYATGALLAAKWLINQKPGLYSMKDVMSK
ncbi:MAG: 4-hydroxy-tetrahydrodipicolinate reductase [Candidatus Parcubacteria bacterium]|nr:4-hydroxy-tetrahydrodipicolinate reductase [Candidatus Parcubacteria bacterium]